MAAPDPVGLVRSYLDAFAGGDPDAIAAHVGEDFANDHRSTLGVSCRGRDEYRRRLPGFLAAFPGLRYEVLDLLADGDRVVVAYTMHAHPEGSALAVPGVMWFDIADGHIIRRVDLFDAGAVPSTSGDATNPALPRSGEDLCHMRIWEKSLTASVTDSPQTSHG